MSTAGSKKKKAKAPERKPSAPSAPSAPQSRLVVVIDGTQLPDDEARAIWTEFSRHMDEHEGDMAGFAKAKGWASVRPESKQGRAFLLVSAK